MQRKPCSIHNNKIQTMRRSFATHSLLLGSTLLLGCGLLKSSLLLGCLLDGDGGGSGAVLELGDGFGDSCFVRHCDSCLGDSVEWVKSRRCALVKVDNYNMLTTNISEANACTGK
jgi:hypothetical protein